MNGHIVRIPAGFQFDLSSIPRVLRPLLDRTELGVRAPLIHDFIYRYHGRLPKESVLPYRSFKRHEADRFFLVAMKEAGIGAVKRWTAWVGVRLMGWLPWPPPRTAMFQATIKALNTAWQTGLAVLVFDSFWGILVGAGLFSFLKSAVWPWMRESVRDVMTMRRLPSGFVEEVMEGGE